MPPQTTAQKAAVTSFVAITGTTERTASKYLKNASYKLNEAVDVFYQVNGGSRAASGSNSVTQLNQLFDSLRDEGEDSKDTLGADSAMRYLQSIGVGLEDASLFLAVHLLQAPSIGEIPRDGFVNGWKDAGIEAKTEAQAAHLKYLAGLMTTERDLFRKVYRYVFVAGKEGDQRAISLEMALLYWDTIFKKPGQSWAGPTTNWLNEWRTFLQDNWKRSVNRDMWNQTLEFAFKSMDDESLIFWNENGAWPGVIDDFVGWIQRKRETNAGA
ncbi:putative defective in cullin neddylation protein 1 [Rosellinia necatrix]|uniref:Defective in cullin neddylation protein n=1 Tax=Rosellinia necatrix TaxID=77044 RepID=A0A1W2TKM7_ROSNE|nr:putative defective in cullin neddylation protein 1 [Rosellinia necatrix]